MPHEPAAALLALVDSAVGDPADLEAALDDLGLTGELRARVVERVQRARAEGERMRRREHELAALSASARELAELRDADAVLTRLVQRAHEMLGADVTYLSEFDTDSRQLRVRTTRGSVSAAFQQLLVPPGRGLASVIVETRAPQWVRRYDDYRADRHEPAVDDAVAAEGLVSLLGVPMLSGDEVLGVLFVGNRIEHDFTPDAVTLLSALADHASVVVQTARTLRDLSTSDAAARGALDELTGHLAERDRANAVHQRLVQAVLAGGGFAPVAETLATALQRPVAIVADDGHPLAASGLPLPGSMLDLDAATVRAIDDSAASGRCTAVTGVDGVTDVLAVSAGIRRFGAVLLGAGPFDLGDVDRRTVERAVQVCSLLALQQEAVTEAEHRTQSELVADLLDDDPDRRSDVDRRVRRLGIAVADLDELLLLTVPGDQRSTAVRALSPSVSGHGLVGEVRGQVVVLTAGRLALTDDELRERVVRAVASPVLAVRVPPARGALPTSFSAAVRTARLVTALGADDGTVAADDYLPYSALLHTDERGIGAFLDEVLGPVTRYDAERGTDLVGTLRAFVRNNASPTRTARALTFHTNTILQRLERLDRVLGPGWRDDERLFRISIAVRLDELRDRLADRSR